ncbi:MAG: mevalonate kinase [Anaerolineales bacterium]|nr:mevalonate kinase [Anaerolineales bacterium]
MPAFTASAPGKVILFGEHAVVYGRGAIAAPVSQVRARAVVRADPHAPAGTVRIQAPDIRLDSTLDQLPDPHPLRLVISALLAHLGAQRLPACTLRITSSIPVASGLGSGAAVSVAVLRALSAFLGHPLPDEAVSALAFEAEKLYHGTPSGIDNTVITYQLPVYFQRGRAIQTLQVKQAFDLLIADTGVASPTSLAVRDVRRAWEADPAPSEAIFDAIGGIALAARQAIQNGENERLGALMDENHAWLQRMGVSSAELDTLVASARAAGAQGAKLSGAGRGGNIIALVEADQADQVSRALTRAGVKRTILTRVATSH